MPLPSITNSSSLSKLTTKRHPLPRKSSTRIKREPSPDAPIKREREATPPTLSISAPPKKRAKHRHGWAHPDELPYLEPGWEQDKTISYLYSSRFSVPGKPGHSTALVRVAEFDVHIPARYRIPLLWVARYWWQSLHLVLNASDRDGEWESFRWGILHLCRLCRELLESAKKAHEEQGMDRRWRCPAFDRALVRFKAKWLIQNPEHIQNFWESFGEEEFEKDVLLFNWKPWALKGHKGFRVTEDELLNGITAENYTNGLKKVAGRWTWYAPLSFAPMVDDDTPGPFTSSPMAASLPNPATKSTPAKSSPAKSSAAASASASGKGLPPRQIKPPEKTASTTANSSSQQAPHPLPRRRRLPDPNNIQLPGKPKPAPSQSASATASASAAHLSSISLASPAVVAAAAGASASASANTGAVVPAASGTDALLNAFTNLSAELCSLREQNAELTAEVRALGLKGLGALGGETAQGLTGLAVEMRELRNEVNLLRMARSYDWHTQSSHPHHPNGFSPAQRYAYAYPPGYAVFASPEKALASWAAKANGSGVFDTPATLHPIGSVPPTPATPQRERDPPEPNGSCEESVDVNGNDKRARIESLSLAYPPDEEMPDASASSNASGGAQDSSDAVAATPKSPEMDDAARDVTATPTTPTANAAAESVGPVKSQRKMMMMGLNGIGHHNGTN